MRVFLRMRFLEPREGRLETLIGLSGLDLPRRRERGHGVSTTTGPWA